MFIAIFLSVGAYAQTSSSVYSLFKRSISPSMSWGENGVMTVPKATTIGRGNVNLGLVTVDSGQIDSQKLYLTSATLMVGTSRDVELGYTKKAFIWEDGKRSNISMDTLHLKIRLLDLADYYIPQVAIGVNGASLSTNQFDTTEDFLFNPYLAVTLPMRVFTDNFIINVTGVAENVVSEGENTETFFSAGVDMQLFKHLSLMAETQGLGNSKADPIVNLGAKATLGWFSLGAGLFNISQAKLKDQNVNADSNQEQYWMLHANVKIPLHKLFGDDPKEKVVLLEAKVKELETKIATLEAKDANSTTKDVVPTMQEPEEKTQSKAQEETKDTATQTTTQEAE